MNKDTGFTLVEISIVLVIIGLILGAAFVGSQTLITNTKTTGTITLIKDLSGAVSDFKSRYHYLPGDLPKAGDDISSVGACDIATSVLKIGDGLINTQPEIDCAPKELVLAGFVKGNATAAGFVSPLNPGTSPDVFVLATSLAAVTTFSSTVQNVIEISGLPCDVANTIDSKIDDGDTQNGNVRSNPPCIPGASGVPATTTLDIAL